MEQYTMFDRLLSMPLFQGMGRDELSEVLRHVRLDFIKYERGDEVVCQGDACRSLVCIINGTLSATLLGDNFTLHEHDLQGISMIEPYNLFGMNRRYSRTYTFATDGEMLMLDREVLLVHILNSRIARVNLLNIVCNQYQKTQRALLLPTQTSASQKIAHFLRSIATVPQGRKTLKMKMTDMAAHLQETRINISSALNNFRTHNLLTFSRGVITIPTLEHLLTNTHPTTI